MLDAMPPGTARAVWADGVPLALFNLGGEVHVLDNVCPHAGGPLVGGARSGPCGGIVVCPWHGWRFDVCTGESPDLPGERVRTFSVRLKDGAIQVAVEVPPAGSGPTAQSSKPPGQS